jgi:hypothetical protein
MARDHARWQTRTWDPASDFRTLRSDAQRLYMVMTSHKSINHAGVLPLQPKKWAGLAPDTTVEDVMATLDVLVAERYVVVDADTEEVLVRTFIRNDGVAKQPNVLKAALRQASAIESPKLRAALAVELRRLGSAEAARVADTIAPNPSGNPSPNPSVNGSGNPSATVDNPVDKNPSGTLPGTPREPIAQGSGEVVGEGGSSSPVGGSVGGSRAGAHTREAPPADQRPPERCPKHADSDGTEPCGPCGAARRAAQAWDADAPQRAASARLAVRDCPWCDGDGWRWVDPRRKAHGTRTGPGARCDHTSPVGVS